MAPATCTIANSSANDELVTRQYVEDALAQIKQMIVRLGAQNNQGARQANQFSRLAKVEFPKFNRDDATKGENISWTDYKDAIALRFGSVYDDPMALLKNAKYDKSAKEYQDTFDTLLSRVEVSEEHAISLYLGGLPTELDMSVRIFRPKTLSDAYCLTTLQEATLEAVRKKSRPFTNQSNSRFGVSNANGTTNKLAFLPKPNTPTPGSVRKQLTQKEYEEKRSKNLCFYCDQKYIHGHKCSGQLYSLLALADNDEEKEEFLDADESLVDTLNEGVQAHIYLNALSANNSKVEPRLQEIINAYVEVFAVPTKLPPIRSQDHRIPLMLGTQPVNIRPYRYPPVQKDAIEAMIKVLLDAGVIKHIQSSFDSLVVMGETKKHYAIHNGQLFRKGKLVVGNNEALRKDLLAHFHKGAISGHSGVRTITHKICSVFYWKGLRKQTKQYVKECLVCQKCKPDLAAYPGLLQPLPIPNTVWTSISMDFIEGLPKSHGCTVILVVVDRLTKYGHFIPLAHPFTAAQVSQVFLDQVCKLHGLPESIVSDRDKVFLSTFWKELFKLLHVKLLVSTSYHPMDKLRSLTAINTTPFEALYGQSPPVHVPYVGGLSKVDAVDRTLWPENKPLRQVSIRQGKQNKFSPKYFGPFEILAKVGSVAYKLKLPAASQIHDVFHVSQLKKLHGTHLANVSNVLPQVDKDGLLEATLIKILDRKIVKENNAVVVYGLIQWSTVGPQDATWELLDNRSLSKNTVSKEAARMLEDKKRIGLSWEPQVLSLLFGTKSVSNDKSKNVSESSLVYKPNSELINGLFVPPNDPKKVNKILKTQVKDTAGESWFDMPAPTLTPELKKDLQLLKVT
nr:hypothetical protein [Tanacetum cinerariifolium]